MAFTEAEEEAIRRILARLVLNDFKTLLHPEIKEAMSILGYTVGLGFCGTPTMPYKRFPGTGQGSTPNQCQKCLKDLTWDETNDVLCGLCRAADNDL